jgi:uncharacterized protein
MTDHPSMWRRLAALVTLVESSPGQVLGRTAIVKLPYLLQELQGLPLGYDFRLYTYGPFVSDVLNDLASAESLGALTVKTVLYPVGYGYEIRSGPAAESIKGKAADWLREHHRQLESVAREFGGLSASELELASTIVYADREFASRSEPVAPDTLVRKVREVKPRFTEAAVQTKVRELQAKGYLSSLGQRQGG